VAQLERNWGVLAEMGGVSAHIQPAISPQLHTESPSKKCKIFAEATAKKKKKVLQTGDRTLEGSGGSWEEAEDRRQEAGGRRQEAGGRRQEAGGRRQEAGGRRQEGGVTFSLISDMLEGKKEKRKR